jgi:ubiquinone/menaquinone biosynthesis C-methylase UbiE
MYRHGSQGISMITDARLKKRPFRWILLPLAPLALTQLLAAQAPKTAHEAHQLHRDPRSYIAALDDPQRDAWQKPADVLMALGLHPGDTVADIGAGSGYFTLRFSHHVGPGGRVYAVDISDDMLAEVKRKVSDAGLTNVMPVHATADDPKLPEGGVDLIFICDTWHHIENRPSYLGRLRTALKPNGRLAIVDFHKKPLPVGPPESMKLTRAEVVAEATAAGFSVAEEPTFLPYQYFLVFAP